MVLVERVSQLTGRFHVMELDISRQAYQLWAESPRRERELVQVAFPNLTPDEREFLRTGITAEEWAEMLGEEV